MEKRYAGDIQAEKKIAHILKAHRDNSGCDLHLDKPMHYLDKYGYNSCLCNFPNPLINYFNIITDNWDLGVMPHEGCLSNQSARVLDAIYLIKSLRQEHLEKLRENSQQQHR